MSRKTLIYLLACAELCLGTYFMLGFLAWLAKLFFFNSGHRSSPAVLAIWLILAGGCFWLYVVAWRKMKNVEKESQRPAPPQTIETEREKERSFV